MADYFRKKIASINSIEILDSLEKNIGQAMILGRLSRVESMQLKIEVVKKQLEILKVIYASR